MTLPHNARISCPNMPRSNTASTPKKACKHTKGGVYIVKVMHIAKGKYIEYKYAKDGMCMPYGMYVLEDKYIKYAKDVAYVVKGKYGKYAKGDHIR